MTWFLPVFLLIAGMLVAYQPKTRRWKQRLTAHFGGDERKVRQRAYTFYLLGFAFFMAALSIFLRM